jgi:hypothetical protein
MLSVVMLCVIILSVIKLSVMALGVQLENCTTLLTNIRQDHLWPQVRETNISQKFNWWQKSFYKIQPRACIIKLFTDIINSVTYIASFFFKANKKLLGNYEDTSLVNYRIYYYRKKFYDTGP